MDIHLFGTRRRGPSGLLTADSYLAEPGGKGANQARAAARLGLSVGLVGRVGDDEFGRLCVDAAESDGVRVGSVGVEPGTRTGFVVIELVEGHHVTRVFVPGANTRLGWPEVEAALDAEPGCGAVLAQAEVPAEVLEGLGRWCAASQVPLFLDPVPPTAVTPEVLGLAEVLTPDMEEAGGLVGRTVDGVDTARLAARELLLLGAARVIVKLGPDGALVADADGLMEVVPTLDVVVEDETGGGDVFLAALAAVRLSGADWLDAVHFANAASALSVGRPGLHLPTWSEVATAVGS